MKFNVAPKIPSTSTFPLSGRYILYSRQGESFPGSAAGAPGEAFPLIAESVCPYSSTCIHRPLPDSFFPVKCAASIETHPSLSMNPRSVPGVIFCGRENSTPTETVLPAPEIDTVPASLFAGALLQSTDTMTRVCSRTSPPGAETEIHGLSALAAYVNVVFPLLKTSTYRCCRLNESMGGRTG